MIRLLESMQKIAILYDASQAILSTFDLDEVLNQILTIIRDYFQLQNGAVLLLDKNKSELSVKVHLGRSNLDVGYRIPLGKGLTGSAAQLKRPIYVPDVSKDPRYLNRVAETRSEVAIPLMVRDEVVGVLDFQSEQLNYFDAEMIDLLTLFSTQASLALENARLIRSNAAAQSNWRRLTQWPGRPQRCWSFLTCSESYATWCWTGSTLIMWPSSWRRVIRCMWTLTRAG